MEVLWRNPARLRAPEQRHRHAHGVCGVRAAGRRPTCGAYFLSGLTCTSENVVTKGGAQARAAGPNLTLVCPDTSPRGPGVADRPHEDDLGMGASFYVNATQAPWAPHYKMYDYIVHELPQLIEPVLPTFSGKRGIFGHSMGGHGALT